jgi:hypothetical protein
LRSLARIALIASRGMKAMKIRPLAVRTIGKVEPTRMAMNTVPCWGLDSTTATVGPRFRHTTRQAD